MAMLCLRTVRSGYRLAQTAVSTRLNVRFGGAWRRCYASSSTSSSSASASPPRPRPLPPTAPSNSSGVQLLLCAIVFTSLGAGASWFFMTQNGMGFFSDEDSNTRAAALVAAQSGSEAARVEAAINELPLVAALRARPDMTESRPHMKMPSSYRAQTLTGGALLGADRLVVPPFCWTEDGGRSMVGISYVGSSLCGHPGIVHGGLVATMLDEGLARCCFAALPHKIGVTANLNINYRRPMPANSFLVLRATTTKVEGRKAWVKGHIELLQEDGAEPIIYAEATALFISPKHAAVMPRIQ